ncbi:MAG: hypothetical protein ABI197_07825 [Granulicella sp.]
MNKICHRCNGDLPSGDDVFCPHCGAPQLLLSEDYLADQQPASDALSPADTTGALPPPMPQQVDWQAAIRCATLVAAIAAVLCIVGLRVPGISFLSTIWILTASTTTLALYHRRRPLAWMDATVGARIGLTTGMAMIVLITSSLALTGVIARFGLHAMAGFDNEFIQMIAQIKQSALQTTATNPAQAELLHLYDLPEFQAGLILATSATAAVLLLLYSTFGGAINGMLRNRRRARV